MYINKVQILGNLTKDPELKALPSGTHVASFSVATNKTIKDSSGAKKEKVEYHNIVVFGKTAENVAQYMKKGSQIYVEGELQTRSWDGQDGKKQYRTEINGNTVQFGNKPQGSKSNGAGGNGATETHHAGGGNGAEQSNDPLESYMNNDSEEINPEDIPF